MSGDIWGHVWAGQVCAIQSVAATVSGTMTGMPPRSVSCRAAVEESAGSWVAGSRVEAQMAELRRTRRLIRQTLAACDAGRCELAGTTTSDP
jgi:hypothetical protein